MNKKGMATIQLTLIVFSIIAFAFILGSSSVSASHRKEETDCLAKGPNYLWNIKTLECEERDSPKTTKTTLGFGEICNTATDNCGVSQGGRSLFCSPPSTSSTVGICMYTQESKSTDLLNFPSLMGTFSTGLGYLSTAKQVNRWVASDPAQDKPRHQVGTSTEKGTSEILKKNILQKFGHGFFHRTPMKGSEYSKELGTTGYETSFGGNLLLSAAYAAAGGIAVYQAAKLSGAGERNLNQIKTGAIGGSTVAFLIANTVAPGMVGVGTAGIAIGLALVYTAFTYQDYSRDIFNYKVGLWQAPTNGENCEDCNDLRYGCSEYQCHTFGQNCELINQGTKAELCIWLNPNDGKPPVIISEIQMMSKDFGYSPTTDTEFSERGVDILYKGNDADENYSIPPFTNVKFGVETDEPAQCRIDTVRKFSYDNMSSEMVEGQAFTYNHTLEIPSSAFPSQYALTELGWKLRTGEPYTFYIRCKDKNGNVDPLPFSISFHIEDGPDTTAPEISSNYVENAYITAGKKYMENVSIYTNEPADCKWDINDLDYNKMNFPMADCSQDANEQTFPSLYKFGCIANFTGIKDNTDNLFYVRCQDKPNLPEDSNKTRVTNQQSYVVNFQGTRPLNIAKITINDKESGTSISDSTSPIKVNLEVTTSQGAEKDGSARCWYTPIEDATEIETAISSLQSESSAVASNNNALRFEFYNNGNFDYTHINEHTLSLGPGNYYYNITCCDVAQNCEVKPITFNLHQDIVSPIVRRAYFEESKLKITTSEEAKCVYSTSTCDYLFEDGIKIQTTNNLEHFVEEDPKTTYYIKCEDSFGNQPIAADMCSIIVKPVD